MFIEELAASSCNFVTVSYFGFFCCLLTIGEDVDRCFGVVVVVAFAISITGIVFLF